METVLILVGGLVARFLLLLLLFALFSAPIVALIYLTKGTAALHHRVAGTVDAGGAHWKPGLTYTAAHAWVRKRWARTVEVGLDDVARRLLAGVSSLALPEVGTKLRPGDVLVTMRCGKRLVTMRSPVEGIVLARNRALMSRPEMFEREPYRDGWMLRVEAAPPLHGSGHRGAESKRWLRSENLRLTHFLETTLGMAAADGGTLTGPPSVLLSDAAWREATRSFLDGTVRST
jgi:glycine cleavage system H protein